MKKLLVIIFVLAVAVFAVSGMTPAEQGYAGTDTCKACHEDRYESYMGSIHAKKAVPNSPANREGCESCHGAGSSHVEKGGGKGTGMAPFGRKTDAKERAKRCLGCHEESKHLAFWNMSRHKSEGVACDDCHAVHSGGDKNLKAKQPDLCYGCHRDIRSQANRQSHHPIREGKVSCTDCHDPHGSFGSKMVKADTVNELCYTCHAEKRGPFIWEHPPVEENCLNCHTAHGSNHSKLLTKKTPAICQSCHVMGQHPRTPYGSASTFSPPGGLSNPNRQVSRACLNCHSNIHGSNGPHGAYRGKAFTR